MLAPQGQYYNFSGCGNTFNCNHPVVQVLRSVLAAPNLPTVANSCALAVESRCYLLMT